VASILAALVGMLIGVEGKAVAAGAGTAIRRVRTGYSSRSQLAEREAIAAAAVAAGDTAAAASIPPAGAVALAWPFAAACIPLAAAAVVVEPSSGHGRATRISKYVSNGDLHCTRCIEAPSVADRFQGRPMATHR